MSEEAAFLALLKANPADDTARLVYADWLDEHDEPRKAEYVRAAVDLTRHTGGTDEYTDAAVRLYTACVQTDADWRKAAGARFDVVLERYDTPHKIHAIKVIRERTGFGLAEAKALAESVPTPLFSWLPFEQALPHLLAFDVRGSFGAPIPIHARIGPTVWPDGPGPEAVFDILVCTFVNDDWGTYAVTGIADLLGVSPNEARARLQHLPLVVGSGLRPTAVADYVRRLKLICNVGRALPDAFRVVPRLPTQ